MFQLSKVPGACEMAQPVKALGAETHNLEFDSWGPNGKMRELKTQAAFLWPSQMHCGRQPHPRNHTYKA